jgi:hypothetical protein
LKNCRSHNCSQILPRPFVIVFTRTRFETITLSVKSEKTLPGLEPRQMQKIYMFNNTSRLAVGSTQLPVQWLPGFCRGCKTAGSEVNNSSPSSADVKHKWSYTSLLPYAFMASTATALPFAITMSHFYNIILKISFHIRIFYIFGFGYSLEAFQLQLTTFMLFPLACYNYVHFMLHVSVVQITRGRLVLYSFLNDFLL